MCCCTRSGCETVIAGWLLTLILWPRFASGNSRGIAIPYQRYELYSDMNSGKKQKVDLLGYSSDTWNMPGSEPIEHYSYSEIVPTSLRPVVDSLGFDEEQWDCFITHYQFYEWHEIEAAGLDVYWKELGWTLANWEDAAENPPPETETKGWHELLPQERDAAFELCYRQELWDEWSLDLWGTLPASNRTALPDSYDNSVPSSTAMNANYSLRWLACTITSFVAISLSCLL